MYESISIYEDDDLEMRFERDESDLLFLHTTFPTMNRRVMRELLFRIEWAKQLAYFMGYEELYTYTQNDKVVKLDKNLKYCFTVGVDDDKFEVYKWELK